MLYDGGKKAYLNLQNNLISLYHYKSLTCYEFCLFPRPLCVKGNRNHYKQFTLKAFTQQIGGGMYVNEQGSIDHGLWRILKLTDDQINCAHE